MIFMPITYVRIWAKYAQMRHRIFLHLVEPTGRFQDALATDWREGNEVARLCIRPTWWVARHLVFFPLCWWFEHIVCRIEDRLKRKAAFAAPQCF